MQGRHYPIAKISGASPNRVITNPARTVITRLTNHCNRFDICNRVALTAELRQTEFRLRVRRILVMTPPASTRHFTGPHHYDGESHGPFSFLNPTMRHIPLPSHKRDGQTSQEESLQDENGEHRDEQDPKHKDEIRAADVHKKWRSRDNRKGNVQPVVQFVSKKLC